ncbi:hypothetical protein, partial [Klebsiella pneumoniae]|uniref:hypothetical protein n=1 Tax=Klebsiella pneumoniae TaxID=573 RepID=UPI0013D3DA70
IVAVMMVSMIVFVIMPMIMFVIVLVVMAAAAGIVMHMPGALDAQDVARRAGMIPGRLVVDMFVTIVML